MWVANQSWQTKTIYFRSSISIPENTLVNGLWIVSIRPSSYISRPQTYICCYQKRQTKDQCLWSHLWFVNEVVTAGIHELFMIMVVIVEMTYKSCGNWSFTTNARNIDVDKLRKQHSLIGFCYLFICVWPFLYIALINTVYITFNCRLSHFFYIQF